MRENYKHSYLIEEECDPDPFVQFDGWFHQALEAGMYEPNAMALATAGSNGQPSVRMVLLKSFDHEGFVFFTNYESRKGHQISDNQKVALLFWWWGHQRQVRIEGYVLKTPAPLNDEYFHSRPKESQIAALISEQSKVVESREVLERLYAEKEKEFGDRQVPLKEHWGGFVVKPLLFEFWQGRESRLHDRLQYTRNESGLWIRERLYP